MSAVDERAPRYGYCPKCGCNRPLELDWSCCGCGHDTRIDVEVHGPGLGELPEAVTGLAPRAPKPEPERRPWWKFW